MLEKNTSKHISWLGLALSSLSGFLLTLSMPGFDVPLLGWIALTPLLVVLSVMPPSQLFLLTLPFGIIFSIGVHNWYPQIFPPALGYFLILAVGFFYAAILQLGVQLTARLPGALKILALPTVWSAIEFLKYIAPVVAALDIPPDRDQALAANPAARDYWDALSRSVKRGILEWIANAKRLETRRGRVAEIVPLAAENHRANQWRPRKIDSCLKKIPHERYETAPCGSGRLCRPNPDPCAVGRTHPGAPGLQPACARYLL